MSCQKLPPKRGVTMMCNSVKSYWLLLSSIGNEYRDSFPFKSDPSDDTTEESYMEDYYIKDEATAILNTCVHKDVLKQWEEVG